MRKTRQCICGGQMFLRTSHHGKAGTYKCVRCNRVEKANSRFDEWRNNITLAITCKQCGLNLQIKDTRIVENRIPFCPNHGVVN